MDIFSLVQTVCAQFMQWSLAMYDEQVVVHLDALRNFT